MAARAPSMDHYLDGKTDFIVGLLVEAGLTGDELGGVAAIKHLPT